MGSAGMVGRRGAVLGLAGVGVGVLGGCAQPGVPAEVEARLGPNRTGYIGISAPIVPRLRDLFIEDVNRLLAKDAREIYVLLSSPGGVVTAAQDMIAFMDKTRVDRGVAFTMHNMNVVASAACYVFLAGQRRYAVPRGTFLFHEASLVSNGALTSQRLQEASLEVQAIERGFLNMLRTRTKLTEGEASSFIRRTVILNADEARRDGIVDRVEPFVLPPGATVFNISTTRPSQTTGVRAVPSGE